MTFEQLSASIKKKEFSPIYFLFGGESFYIDQLEVLITEHAITEDEKEFNYTAMYGKDSSVNQIIECCKRFPMMAERQLVVLREAQGMPKKEFEKLVDYIQNPFNSTIFVICFKADKGPDGRTEIGKLLKKSTTAFEAKKLYDNQVPAWLTSYVRSHGYSINPQAAQILADNIGNNISNLASTCQKLFILVPKKTEITPDIIEQNVGISKEFNVYEFSDAIGSRDIMKANRIALNLAKSKDTPPVRVINTLTYYFCDLIKIASNKITTLPNDQQSSAAAGKLLGKHPFVAGNYVRAARNFPPKKLIEIVSILREADRASKGLSGQGLSNEGIMKELVFKILH